MALVIGVDEAGYGPNLGPLVISATVWEVPGDPHDFDFWQALRRVVCQRPRQPVRTAAGGRRGTPSLSAAAVKGRTARLHVADSKQVYSPARGLGSLETSVLSLLGAQAACASLSELWLHLCGTLPDADCGEPWFDGNGLALALPFVADEREIAGFVVRLQKQLDAAQLRLRCVASDVVLTERFNRLTSSLGTKGAALSQTTLELVRRIWNPERDGPAVLIADKHGGRSHYQGLLADVFDALPLCLNEGPECSRYRLGKTEMRFEARAERHLPVAVASMVSKYIRELAMEAFNRYWRTHLPDLLPTKGYPTDARRFRADIAPMQAQLQIPDSVLWRER